LCSVVQGYGDLYLGNRQYRVRTGDGFFLNANLPHMLQPLSRKDVMVLFVHLKPPVMQALLPTPSGAAALRPFLADQKHIIPVIRKSDTYCSALQQAFLSTLDGGPLADIRAWRHILDGILKVAERIGGTGLRKSTDREGTAEQVVRKALDQIHTDASASTRIDTMAQSCGVSASYLAHHFTDAVGESPIAYRNRLRITNAYAMLAAGNASIEEVATTCGFSSISQFRRLFKRLIGRPPSAVRG
jgi:AraC-like DNA-binding protein